MKKHTMMFLSFSALLTVNAFAPQMFWDAKHTGRSPSSYEEDRLEALELQKKEEQAKKDSVQCLKDDKASKLEEEIKKLMSDKESILKELADLKKDKKEEPAKKDDKKDEAKKPVAKKESQESVLDIMSQLTSLMMSQQQQQMMMMQEMFSMMSYSNMDRQYSYPGAYPGSYRNPYVNNHMSPFAYQHDTYVQPEYRSPFSFDTMNYGVGLMWNQQPQAQVQPAQPQAARMPSAQSLQAANPIQYQAQPEMPSRVFAEPQFQTPDMTRSLFQ